MTQFSLLREHWCEQSALETREKADIYFLDREIIEIVCNLAVNGHEKHVDVLIERIRKSAGHNQDSINVILQLVNKAKGKCVIKILRCGVRQDGKLKLDNGSFLIRQLVHSGRPLDSIIKTYKFLEEEEFNPRALLITVKAAIAAGSTSTVALLREIIAAHPSTLLVASHLRLKVWSGWCRTSSPWTQVVKQLANTWFQSSRRRTSTPCLHFYKVPEFQRRQ